MKSDIFKALSDEDANWLERTENHILGILRTHYGETTLNRNKDDLAILQRLFADRLIKVTDILEAQCVGVAFGNVLVATTPLLWMRVKNEYGDMIALHHDSVQLTLYPLTMISQRLEDGRTIDLPSLYDDLFRNLNIQKTGEPLL